MGPPATLHSREVVYALVVSAAWIGFVWAITSAGGAVGIPRSDDWSYLLTQFDFAKTGDFILNNWAVTMLVGQTMVAAPTVALIGESITALQLLVATFSVLALVMTYVVIRRALGVGWSALCVAILAVSPIFGPSVVSFMTDIPALFFLSLSLLLGIEAGQQQGKPSIAWFAFAVVAAVVAFTFRDYAIIALLPIVWVRLLRATSSSQRAVSGAIVAAGFLIAGGLYWWRHSLPNDLKLDGWTIDFSITLVARAALTVALLVVPVLAAVNWRRILSGGSRRETMALTVLAFVIAGLVLVVARLQLLGNVIHPYGSTWLISGSGVRIWPLWVNRGLLLLAVIALAAVFVFGVRWLRAFRSNSQGTVVNRFLGWSRDNSGACIVALFPVALLAAHSSATLLLGTWFIDRYFILVLPFLAAAIVIMGRKAAWMVSGRATVIPVAVLLVYGVWGLHVTDFDARFDGARWDMGLGAQSQGFAPESIDAGMQWVSFHARDIGLGAQQVPTRDGRPWWTERYPAQDVCVTVFAVDPGQPPPAGEILSQREVVTLLGVRYELLGVRGPDAC